MKFSPLHCHLVPLRPKYSPQHAILNHTPPSVVMYVRLSVRPYAWNS
jgi:hypothetical protein